MEYELVPLHHNKHHFDECTAILNREWPRSEAAREHSLNKSCDSLPCCLVYRRKDNGEVIGYSQIVSVQGKDSACLFESVIVRDDLRGRGLGRKLMDATEDYAKKMKFKVAYLNTLDKQSFYSNLGYSQCGPVISLGANASRVSAEFLQKLMCGASSSCSSLGSVTTDNNCSATIPSSNVEPVPPFEPPPPPPPPPMPTPPPPPLPPPPSTQRSQGALSRHVIRMDPNAVTWMHKPLR